MIEEALARIKDEDLLTLIEKKIEENDKHFFQNGFKYAHAYLRHIAKNLECNAQLGDCLRDYLEQFHESHFEDNCYRDGYIATEEGAEDYLNYYLNGEEEND